MYQSDPALVEDRREEKLPECGREDVLPNHLEADQLAAETSRPVPRARLSVTVRAGLWALRVFVVVVSVMVIYVFVSQLGH